MVISDRQFDRDQCNETIGAMEAMVTKLENMYLEYNIELKLNFVPSPFGVMTDELRRIQELCDSI